MTHKYSIDGWHVEGDSFENFNTVLIIGHERSGTSMIAGTLDKLGVFLGEQCAGAVFEDERLSKSLKSSKGYKDVIKDYDENHDLWAFKRPTRNKEVLKRLKYFKRPLLIYIHRDSVAVAMRCAQVYRRSLTDELKRVTKSQNRLLSSVLKARNTTKLFSSYEKILNKPESFVDSLIELLGLNVTDEQKLAAVNFISPEPIHYLNACEPYFDFRGYIDQMKGNIVSGWIVNRKKPELPVDLEVLVNGKVIKSSLSQTLRDDVKVHFKHPTGMCGFDLKIEDTTLCESDDIIVKVKNDDYQLSKASGFSQL